MNSEIIKKLTGKNPQDFEFAAAHIINKCDLESFSKLVEKSDFLFDFIKQNVIRRLQKAINNNNYRNLINFLTVYSSDYENLIVSNLVKHANEDLTDEMLNFLENGTEEQKTYAAKYFSFINDTLAIDLLRKNSYADFDPLTLNCAQALSAMKDEESYNLAIRKLDSQDDFERVAAVRFLVSFGDTRAINAIFETMKKSSMPENIASEISYLQSFLDFLDTDFKYDTILAINHIINGLGEIVSLSQIFDFELYEVLSKLIEFQHKEKNSKIALVLLNAKLKFDQLTENEEYIFDEEKDIKNEVYVIKNLLISQSKEFWDEQTNLFQKELNPESDFILFALELVQELNLIGAFDKLKSLLNSLNQTAILKTVEVIKFLGKLDEINKDEILQKVSDENIKSVIQALF